MSSRGEGKNAFSVSKNLLEREMKSIDFTSDTLAILLQPPKLKTEKQHCTVTKINKFLLAIQTCNTSRFKFRVCR